MCALFSEAIWPQHLLSRYRQVTQAAISIPRHLIIGPGTAFTFMAVSAAFVGSGLTTIAYDSKKIDIMSQRVWKKGRNRMQCEADVLSLAVFAALLLLWLSSAHNTGETHIIFSNCQTLVFVCYEWDLLFFCRFHWTDVNGNSQCHSLHVSFTSQHDIQIQPIFLCNAHSCFYFFCVIHRCNSFKKKKSCLHSFWKQISSSPLNWLSL